MREKSDAIKEVQTNPTFEKADYNPSTLRTVKDAPKMIAKERTKHINVLSIIAISLAIAMITACGFTVWRVVHFENKIKAMQQTTSELSDSHQYDEARDTAKREKYSASDFFIFIKDLFAGNLEERIIDRKEAENLRENGLTIGRSSSDFVNLTYQEAQAELAGKGFTNITSSYIISNSSKYKKTAEDTVIGIRIGDKDKFRADDKFLPDISIEILYLKKDSEIIDNSSDSTDLGKPPITIGKKSKELKGVPLEEVLIYLIDRGFEEENIRTTSIESHSIKYRKTEDGAVISVIINGKESFKETEQFPPNSSIEVYYYQAS